MGPSDWTWSSGPELSERPSYAERKQNVVPPIQIDRDACIGSQNCVRAAPATFAIDDEGIAVVRAGAAAEPTELLLAVIDRCPVRAIALADTAGSEPHGRPG